MVKFFVNFVDFDEARAASVKATAAVVAALETRKARYSPLNSSARHLRVHGYTFPNAFASAFCLRRCTSLIVAQIARTPTRTMPTRSTQVATTGQLSPAV
jgi:hypothetical protein